MYGHIARSNGNGGLLMRLSIAQVARLLGYLGSHLDEPGIGTTAVN